MSCSSRVKKSGGRRLDNNSNSSNNRRSLLFLLGSNSTSDGMGNNPASAWFHNSLQHLSHSWHRFNKFGISRDKKADRCSTWFVDQADNNNKPLPFFSFARFVCLTSVFLCLDFIHPSIRTFVNLICLFLQEDHQRRIDRLFRSILQDQRTCQYSKDSGRKTWSAAE